MGWVCHLRVHTLLAYEATCVIMQGSVAAAECSEVHDLELVTEIELEDASR
jgi:hypothetical protein